MILDILENEKLSKEESEILKNELNISYNYITDTSQLKARFEKQLEI